MVMPSIDQLDPTYQKEQYQQALLNSQATQNAWANFFSSNPKYILGKQIGPNQASTKPVQNSPWVPPVQNNPLASPYAQNLFGQNNPPKPIPVVTWGNKSNGKTGIESMVPELSKMYGVGQNTWRDVRSQPGNMSAEARAVFKMQEDAKKYGAQSGMINFAEAYAKARGLDKIPSKNLTSQISNQVKPDDQAWLRKPIDPRVQQYADQVLADPNNKAYADSWDWNRQQVGGFDWTGVPITTNNTGPSIYNDGAGGMSDYWMNYAPTPDQDPVTFALIQEWQATGKLPPELEARYGNLTPDQIASLNNGANGIGGAPKLMINGEEVPFTWTPWGWIPLMGDQAQQQSGGSGYGYSPWGYSGGGGGGGSWGGGKSAIYYNGLVNWRI